MNWSFTGEITLAFDDLRAWIKALDKAGELKRIRAEVDPVLEVTEITDRVSKWGARGGKGPGGPALLEALGRRGILLRDRRGDFGRPGWVRITIGTRAQTRELIRELEKAWKRVRS